MCAHNCVHDPRAPVREHVQERSVGERASHRYMHDTTHNSSTAITRATSYSAKSGSNASAICLRAMFVSWYVDEYSIAILPQKKSGS
jgi:hypothetical protein